jgi:hypothetical protein
VQSTPHIDEDDHRSRAIRLLVGVLRWSFRTLSGLAAVNIARAILDDVVSCLFFLLLEWAENLVHVLQTVGPEGRAAIRASLLSGR